MSCHTSTWPVVPGPAPMPTVGTRSAASTAAATSEGTISIRTANAPAASRARADTVIRSAAPAPRPCTR